MKAFKLIDHYLQLLEQDEVEEIDASVDVEVEETPSPGEITAADLLTGAFVWSPTDDQRTSIEELSFRFSDKNPRLVIKSVVMYLPDKLKTVYAEGPGRSGWGDITSEGEIYLAKLMADAFVYPADSNEIKIANQSMKTLGVINPTGVIEEIERLLQFSDQGVEQDLENLEDEEIQGDEDIPQEATKESLDRVKDLIDSSELDEAQLKKLYGVISAFKGYRPIKGSLQGKGFNPVILKKFSRDVMMLIEDLPKEDQDAFFNIVQSGRVGEFPEKGFGNLFQVIGGLGLSSDLVRQIISHTGQDAAKRGVGMGEVALALLFSNISSAGASRGGKVSEKEENIKAMKAAAKKELGRGFLVGNLEAMKKKGGRHEELALGIEATQQELKAIGPAKGDLELNGKEFEIKGAKASLGSTPDVIYKRTSGAVNAGLRGMGIENKTAPKSKIQKYVVGGDDGPEFQKMTEAISHAYKETDNRNKGKFEKIFRDFIQKGGDYDEASMGSSIFNAINLNSSKSIQRGIAILNLYRYALEEGFEYFMAHDIGSEKGEPGGVGGVGEYIFVGGEGASPELIANEVGNLVDAGKVRFERLKPSNLRPRIGFKTAMTSSDEETLDI